MGKDTCYAWLTKTTLYQISRHASLATFFSQNVKNSTVEEFSAVTADGACRGGQKQFPDIFNFVSSVFFSWTRNP